MTEQEYLEHGKYIWQNFVPKSGQSEFVHAELLRSIEKLRDEAHGNGNINFHEKCHLLLIDFLRSKLSDNELFDEAMLRQINSDLNKISIEDRPYLEDDIFDRISHRVIDWYLHYGEEVRHEQILELAC